MKKRNEMYVEELVTRFPGLMPIKQNIIEGYLLMEEAYEKGGKLLVAGNGGSAADSEHIVGELMKKFQIPRPVPQDFAKKLMTADLVRGAELAGHLEQPLMAIALTGHDALSTAFLNDVDGEMAFA